MSFAACGFESHWAHWLISLVGVGLLIIEDYVSVGELVDTPDLGSGVLRGVWVRVPPGALAAGVFGVSSCRSRPARVMMGGTRFAGLAQLVEQPPCKRLVGGSSPPSGSGVDSGA